MTWQAVTPQVFELGESPFWHPHELMLYWVDIPGKCIHRCNIFMGSVESWAMPTEPGSMAPAESGGLVIALRDGIYRARQWGGALIKLASGVHDTATTRFNDGKADPAGRFWAGTMFEPRTSASAGLFVLDGGALAQKVSNATIANGLAWSPDANTLYWADTPTHTVRAWNFNAATSALTNERVFKRWPGKPAGWQFGKDNYQDYGGRPDGAAVDAEGNYYVAMFEGARICKLSPGGQELASIPVPAQCPTMPCFGGDDLKTLFVTTACYNRSAAELQAYPQSGCVLSMRVDVPGQAVNFYRD
ncbi:MAG: SMP-30/gluconolactonase/LRE family protein [Polaromonas sp.]|jgi:sugar lactone lactonase YvrE